VQTLTLQANQETAIADAETADRIIEYAQGLPVFRATKQVGSQSQRLQDAIERQHQLQRRSSHLLILPQLSLAAVVEVGLMILLGLGILLVLQRSLSIPALWTSLQCVASFH
jgi:ATP-binding cassette, subfamily B, bacterial IrtB/YbtQ